MGRLKMNDSSLLYKLRGIGYYVQSNRKKDYDTESKKKASIDGHEEII